MRIVRHFKLIALAASLLCVSSAWAHDLGLECKLDGEVVRVEAYYDDDTPCAGAKIHTEDASRKVLLAGRTDAEGRWSFPRPGAGRYVVIVNDGAGHVARGAIVIAGSAEDSVRVSEGKSREEFTAFRWQGLAIGIGVIAAVAIGVRWVLRRGARS